MNSTALLALTSSLITSSAAWFTFPPFALIFLTRISRLSATMVLRIVAGKEMDCEEPTARNSNLLPVNAKGDVLLRSVLSLLRTGSFEIPRSMIASSVAFVILPFSMLSRILVSCSPRNTEMIAGGASLAPSL
ncbi:MAG: hypothetical protein MZU95_00065 [Desulfomicrobium escambiense]|nr:hypothetical protein [Desulfomicrobium escambiense]